MSGGMGGKEKPATRAGQIANHPNVAAGRTAIGRILDTLAPQDREKK